MSEEMIINLKKITNAMNKISALTSGDKSIPGVLLDLNDNLLNVCYTDGHKALIEKLEVEVEEGDRQGKVVVPYEMFNGAIQACQPSGIIRVEDVKLTSKDNGILTVSVDQMYNRVDNEGNVIGVEKNGTKEIDIQYLEPDEN